MNVTVKRWLIALIILALAINALTMVSGARSAMRRLNDQRVDLHEIRHRIEEMERVADAPRVAALDIESPDEIVNRINAAIGKSGLPADSLDNQTTSEPQRIDKSDFTSRSVIIKLKSATVPQIVAFCEALRDETTGSVVRDLSLFNPNRAGARETWESQMTLTQTIFSPKSDS